MVVRVRRHWTLWHITRTASGLESRGAVASAGTSVDESSWPGHYPATETSAEYVVFPQRACDGEPACSFQRAVQQAAQAHRLPWSEES